MKESTQYFLFSISSFLLAAVAAGIGFKWPSIVYVIMGIVAALSGQWRLNQAWTTTIKVKVGIYTPGLMIFNWALSAREIQDIVLYSQRLYGPYVEVDVQQTVYQSPRAQ